MPRADLSGQTEWVAACSACGSVVPEDARFCPACGHSVAGPGDERRVATVLFADLAGFTALSETLDPEHVKNLVDRCFGRLAADVTGHGGRVDKVVGDAIVALFGAPVAHEDDAERAVRSGLAMQETIRSLADEAGLPLRLRVGINSGEVLVGGLRAGGDYTAMGDTVNVASRLQTLAEPGVVLVGSQTQAATASVVRYESVGQLQARGREAPVAAWRAIEPVSPPGRRRREAGGRLIGRDDELVLLRGSVANAVCRSRPLVALLLGEAGMGKTRLAEEVAGWAAEEHGALVLEGRCVPYGQANPWWPIAEAVRRACGIEPGDPAEVSATKVRDTVARVCGDEDAAGLESLTSGLLYLMGDESALADVDPARAQQDARRSLHLLVAGLARRQPVVVLLSELHWADDVVLDLLGWHLDRLGGLPVVLLATARPELTEHWTPAHGRFNLVTLHLDPLSEVACRELAVVLGNGELTPELVDSVITRSSGNPFFLEELIGFVGDARSRPGDLPVTLRGLVAARIDALPREERSVLEDAAVIGRSGTVTILAALSGSRGLGDADEIIGRLFERELLKGDDGRWEFRSAVVHDVVYETLTKSERARRHWHLADWLDRAGRRTGRADEFAELTAHHYASAAELEKEMGPVAGVPDGTLALALKAISRAAAGTSRRELAAASVRLLDRGVALASPGSPERRRMLTDRALERATLRDLDGAAADLREVFESAEGRDLAQALTVLGYLRQLEEDLPAAAATLTAALSEWRALGDRAGEGEALRRFGMARLQAGDTVGAEAALSEALDIARQLGNRREEAWALWHLAEMAFYAGRRHEAEDRLRSAGNAFGEAGDTGGLGWVTGLQAYLRFAEGDRREAQRLVETIIDEVQERGDRWAFGMVVILMASVHLWEGRASRAAEMAGQAAAAFREVCDSTGERRAAGVQARALAATGRDSEAWELLRSLAGDRGPGMAADPELGLVNVAAHLGDWRTALGSWEESRMEIYAGQAEITRGVALLQAGRAEEALRVLEPLAAGTAAERGGEGAAADALSALALAQATTGDRHGATGSARQVLDRSPAATYRDRTFAHLALALANAGRDPEDSASELEAARETSATDDIVTAAVVELAACVLHPSEPPSRPLPPPIRDWLDRLRPGGQYDGWARLLEAAAGRSKSG